MVFLHQRGSGSGSVVVRSLDASTPQETFNTGSPEKQWREACGLGLLGIDCTRARRVLSSSRSTMGRLDLRVERSEDHRATHFIADTVRRVRINTVEETRKGNDPPAANQKSDFNGRSCLFLLPISRTCHSTILRKSKGIVPKSSVLTGFA